MRHLTINSTEFVTSFQYNFLGKFISKGNKCWYQNTHNIKAYWKPSACLSCLLISAFVSNCLTLLNWIVNIEGQHSCWFEFTQIIVLLKIVLILSKKKLIICLKSWWHFILSASNWLMNPWWHIWTNVRNDDVGQWLGDNPC